MRQNDKQLLIEQIYYDYRNLMYCIANEILHDDKLSEDAVHEAMLKIIKNPYGIDIENKIRTKNYIAKISRSVSCNLYNKYKKHQAVQMEPEQMLMHETESTDNPEEFVISNETIKEIEEEINKMDTRYSDPLRLQKIEKLSIAQVAEVLGISKRTVSYRVEQARRILKNTLRKADSSDEQ